MSKKVYTYTKEQRASLRKQARYLRKMAERIRAYDGAMISMNWLVAYMMDAANECEDESKS